MIIVNFQGEDRTEILMVQLFYLIPFSDFNGLQRTVVLGNIVGRRGAAWNSIFLKKFLPLSIRIGAFST